MSLPPSPEIASLPPSPAITSLPSVPLSVSSPSVPMTSAGWPPQITGSGFCTVVSSESVLSPATGSGVRLSTLTVLVITPSFVGFTRTMSRAESPLASSAITQRTVRA